jgi:TonB-dependent starch-binding outer membrane protein SusC
MKTIYKKLLFLFLVMPLGVFAQSSLSGVVVDAKSNQPLPGVNVIVQGASNSTTTDFDGKFQLNGLKKDDKIVFSFIGYKSETIIYSGQKSVNVSLEEEANQLQEVVVQIGYGAVKKKDATGAVTTLTAKEFNKGANVTVENLLNGRIAGVSVNSGGGAPGTGTQIRIRGGSSLNASNDPLIVIDGLPLDDRSNTGSTSLLAAINPNDIETFSVLKDASATAIYGARAANGVILITTKKGGKKLSVDYNFQYGSGRNFNEIDLLDANQFRALIGGIEAQNIANGSTESPGYLTNRLGNANTNWQDAIYRRTDFVDNSLSVRGQLFNKIPSRLTIGNTYQQGARLTNDFTRNTVSVALNPRFFKDHLKINVSANYANERNRFADGVEGTAIRFDPTQPVFNANSPFGGFFEYQAATPNGLAPNSPRNPVAQLLQTDDRGINNRIYGNFEIDYKFHFLPALRAVVNVGFDESNGERNRFVAPGTASGPSLNDVLIGNRSRSERTLRNKLFDGYLNYNKLFGKTNVEVTAGYSYQKWEDSGFNTNNLLDPTSIPPQAFADTDRVLIGYFGRSILTYDGKYILTASLRRDGTSRFGEKNRWGNFPAAAFAWKIKEDFFKNNKIINDLKLRLGWGISGQQNINVGDAYLAKFNVGQQNSQYFIGGTAFPIASPVVYNPNLTWEETTSYNFGIDYGILDNRISGSVDLFYKLSEDLFFNPAPFADGSNFSNEGPVSVGSFSAKGVELTINADIVRGEGNGFDWNVNFNATKFERRIEELPSSDILVGSTGLGFGGTSQIQREGFTPESFYVFKQLYDAAGRPIENAYADLNGDGVINDSDKYIYKNPDPDLLLGFSSTMKYHNFDLFFNLRASIGNRILNQVNATRAYTNYSVSNDAQFSNIPSAVFDTNFTNNGTQIVLSDYYVENGSFLRMDNITLGYTFPKWLNGKASLRLFTGVQNAFIITEYSGLDPEINSNGRDNTIYPRQRQFLFGANLKF